MTISYQPTQGLSYDPGEAVYWDPHALQQEIQRAFEICHGCRMCFKYCDAFTTLFKLIDEQCEGQVDRLEDQDVDRVMEACFQCKLCEVQCPYTPRDGHEFQLDFPALVHRYFAHRTRAQGLRLGERALSKPDLAGKLARASLGLANLLNRFPPHRWLLERTLGVHRRKLLPEFASRTFERWASRTGRLAPEPGGEVVLFQTCYVEHNAPQIGRDAVEVLERSQVQVSCVAGLRCCGMPAWERGDLKALQQQAHHNLELLEPFVAAGARVMALNPTCSMMLRSEYPRLVAPEDRERATRIAAAVADPGEYLWELRREGRLSTDFRSSPGGTVACHIPCHLRAQAVGFKGRDLIRRLPGVEKVVTVMECCGHNGTYAMRVDGFEPSARLGARAFTAMREAQASTWTTDCPLATLQFRQHAGVEPLHPISVLARAYRGDPFPEETASSGADPARPEAASPVQE